MRGQSDDHDDVDHAPLTSSGRKDVFAKLMDYLARRTYSEFELRQKLEAAYPLEDVDDAISRAKLRGWIAPAEETAARLVGELNRKRKGQRLISQYLEAKGLPSVALDPELEFAKARELLTAKFKHDFETEGPLAQDLMPKAQRLLFNRGFDSDTGPSSPCAPTLRLVG